MLRRIDEGSNEDTILRQFSDHGVDLGALYGFLRAGKIQDVASLRGQMVAALVAAVGPATAGTPNAANSNAATPNTANLTTTKSTAAPRALPLDKLPAFDAVRPYLGTGGMLGQRHDDGWSILSFTFANPPK